MFVVYAQDLSQVMSIGNGSNGDIQFPANLLFVDSNSNDGCFSTNMFKQPNSLYSWSNNFTRYTK